MFLLPREVLANDHISEMLTRVYNTLGRKEMDHNSLCIKDITARISAINLDEYAELLDKDSVISLYTKLYMKDVFAQQLKRL